MATIRLEHIKKLYSGNKDLTVVDFNLEVKDKEFVVLVGGSGCGKSTLLRMIAGLEEITDGYLYINDELMNNAAPGDRRVAMVFQSYALYPHLTVYDNIAFALRLRRNRILARSKANEVKQQYSSKQNVLREEYDKAVLSNPSDKKQLSEQLQKDLKILKEECILEVQKTRENDPLILKKNQLVSDLAASKDEDDKKRIKKEYQDWVNYYKIEKRREIDNKVRSTAKMLGLLPYLDKKPKTLSGGQRQRVAIGRAIARGAKILLMDEPLSNLDAKMRVEMRSNIIKLHEELGITTIYVTHDQVEAMTMAHRIVIMDKGVAQQIGTPKEVYDRPVNLFVAAFIGTPAMNFLFGKVTDDGCFVFEDKIKIKLIDSDFQQVKAKGLLGKEIILGIRPEDIFLSYEENPNFVALNVDIAELLGSDYHLQFNLGEKVLGLVDIGDDEIKKNRIIARVKAEKIIHNGETVYLGFDTNKIHLFDLENTNRVN